MFTKFCELPCAASQHQYVAYSSRCQFCYFALLLMKPNYDVTHILWRNDLVEGSWMQARFWNKVGRKSLFLGPQSKPKTSKGNKASFQH